MLQKNAVSTSIIAQLGYENAVMIITHPPKTSGDFKNCSSKYVGIGPPSYMSPSVVDIPLVSCVWVRHQCNLVLYLGSLSWGGTLISWWIQGSFALPDVIWVHRDFFPLAAKLPPSPAPVLEHGDFTLLLCKACFSVWVWQTHGFLQGEVIEDTQQR